MLHDSTTAAAAPVALLPPAQVRAAAPLRDRPLTAVIISSSIRRAAARGHRSSRSRRCRCRRSRARSRLHRRLCTPLPLCSTVRSACRASVPSWQHKQHAPSRHSRSILGLPLTTAALTWAPRLRTAASTTRTRTSLHQHPPRIWDMRPLRHGAAPARRKDHRSLQPHRKKRRSSSRLEMSEAFVCVAALFSLRAHITVALRISSRLALHARCSRRRQKRIEQRQADLLQSYVH